MGVPIVWESDNVRHFKNRVPQLVGGDPGDDPELCGRKFAVN